MLIAPLLLVAPFGVMAGSVEQQPAGQCALAAVSRTEDPQVLRFLRERCGEASDVAAAALSKLNALPPPASPQLMTHVPMSVPSIERVAFAVDIFFGRLETYPLDDELEKLGHLVELMNTTDLVVSVELGGSADVDELRLLSGESIKQRRTEFVLRYLRAAGLEENVPVTTSRLDARYGKTPDTRAKDRVVEMTVFCERKLPKGAPRINSVL